MRTKKRKKNEEKKIGYHSKTCTFPRQVLFDQHH